MGTSTATLQEAPARCPLTKLKAVRLLPTPFSTQPHSASGIELSDLNGNASVQLANEHSANCEAQIGQFVVGGDCRESGGTGHAVYVAIVGICGAISGSGLPLQPAAPGHSHMIHWSAARNGSFAHAQPLTAPVSYLSTALVASVRPQPFLIFFFASSLLGTPLWATSQRHRMQLGSGSSGSGAHLHTVGRPVELLVRSAAGLAPATHVPSRSARAAAVVRGQRGGVSGWCGRRRGGTGRPMQKSATRVTPAPCLGLHQPHAGFFHRPRKQSAAQLRSLLQ